MTFAQRKLLMMAAWAGTVVTVAVVLAIDTPLSWAVFGSAAIAPVMMANWLWTDREATLAKSIVPARSRS